MATPVVTCVCVNPAHLVLVTQAVNVSHNGCANGTPEMCPHEPKCLWHDRHTGSKIR